MVKTITVSESKSHIVELTVEQAEVLCRLGQDLKGNSAFYRDVRIDAAAKEEGDGGGVELCGSPFEPGVGTQQLNPTQPCPAPKSRNPLTLGRMIDLAQNRRNTHRIQRRHSPITP